jgi:hypothetical protein
VSRIIDMQTKPRPAMPPLADAQTADDSEPLHAEVVDAFLALDADVRAACRALLDEDFERALDARLAEIRRSAN